MDYKIVDRIPEKETIHYGGREGGGKWQELFKGLPVNKAVELRYPTKIEAEKVGSNLHGSFRYSRHMGFSIRYRLIPDGKEFILYCWKVQTGGTQ